MRDVEIDTSFDVELVWGSKEGEHPLQHLITVPALPPVGTVIELKYETRDDDVMFFASRRKAIRYAVEVEKVILDAEDPEDAGYMLFVIPA